MYNVYIIFYSIYKHVTSMPDKLCVHKLSTAESKLLLSMNLNIKNFYLSINSIPNYKLYEHIT